MKEYILVLFIIMLFGKCNHAHSQECVPKENIQIQAKKILDNLKKIDKPKNITLEKR